MAQPLYQLKITLLECEPAVWRHVLVKRSLTLRQLHRVIQAVMGWKDYHLYEFQAGGGRFGEPDSDDPDEETQPAAATRLNWMLRAAGERALYVYDFGDEWRHEVLLEDMPPVDERKTYPICLAGEGACPPEDIGGPYSYREYLELLHGADAAGAEAARLILGRRFDPARFDVKSANRRLKAPSTRRR